MTSGLTIALLGRDFTWAGGIDFLRHLANGLLAKQQTNKLNIYLLLPLECKTEAPFDIMDFFLNTQGGRVDVVYHENSYDGLLSCFRKINADVVMPVSSKLGSNYPVPWVGYAFDFQHKYFPENFTSLECSNRDRCFAMMFRDAAAAIMNSRSVKNDVFRNFPHTKTKVYILPFSPNPIPEWFEELPYDVLEKYSLPEKYFLISNQFWIHKDHLTAFKALTSLDCTIVCTGALSDWRWPNYMAEIRDFLVRNNLTERVKLLGHIPKRDQIEIMKKSIAVVQPTLFEGGPGGGCVYDAVALGVPAIISDIPVNKEAEADNIRFFRAGDCEDLSEKMRDVQRSEFNRPEKEQLIMMGQTNLKNLGDCLLEAVSYVV